MPSYNGVGILSKYKADSTYSHVFCNKNDSRHIEVKYKGLRIHSVYVPAGGDIPDASVNKKFEHICFNKFPNLGFCHRHSFALPCHQDISFDNVEKIF